MTATSPTIPTARFQIGQRVRYVGGNVDWTIIGLRQLPNAGIWVYTIRPYKNGHDGDSRGARECELEEVYREREGHSRRGVDVAGAEDAGTRTVVRRSHA